MAKLKQPCEKCLENNWGGFEHHGRITRATCQNCAHEIEWVKFKSFGNQRFSDGNGETSEPITEEGQVCRKCGTPVVRCEHKNVPAPKPGGYYFKSWLKCPHPRCRTLYMLESEKVYFDAKVTA